MTVEHTIHIPQQWHDEAREIAQRLGLSRDTYYLLCVSNGLLRDKRALEIAVDGIFYNDALDTTCDRR